MGNFYETQVTRMADYLSGKGEYPIHTLIAFGMNHHMWPQPSNIEAAFEGLDFFVNVDMYKTETCDYADIILPAATALEREQLLMMGRGMVVDLQPIIEPMGEVRNDMDIILDLWLNTIYNDFCIPGSDVGPVVYIRNGSRSPLIGYEELGRRWGVSKSTAGRIMRKLEESGYIKMVAFQGKYGTAIYLCNYLSTMFQISDIKIDKEEVAMSLNINVNIPEEEEIMEENEVMDAEKAIAAACQNGANEVSESQICVLKNFRCVPKTHLVQMVKKAAKALYLQGISCCTCTRARYLLYPLSYDCKSKIVNTELLIRCPDGETYYRFAMTIEPVAEKNESEVI